MKIVSPDTSPVFESYIQAHLSELAPPGYILQKKTRNGMHQQGYVETLFAVVACDGFTAILGYLKLYANLSIAMEHKTFEAFRIQLLGGGVLIYNLPDNWEYPVDPWKKEWWYYR